MTERTENQPGEDPPLPERGGEPAAARGPHEIEMDPEKSISESHLLLVAAQNGDGSAFGKLAASLRPFLKYVVRDQLRGKLQGKQDESDVVQQTMVRAIENLDAFRGETPQQWRAWLASIAKNEARNAGRFWNQDRRNTKREARSAVDQVSIDTDSDMPGEIAARREQTAGLMAVIAELPAEQQQLIQWRHFEGLSHAEIAEKLGIAEDTVRQRWATTKQLLRKSIRKANENT